MFIFSTLNFSHFAAPHSHSSLQHADINFFQKKFHQDSVEKNSLYKNYISNPLHPNISTHILHTGLNTFPNVLAKRICLTINWFFCKLSFPLFLWPWRLIHGWNWKEKLDAGHSGIKGLNIEVFKINSSLSWVNGSTKGLQGLGYAESPRSLILPSTKTLGRAFLTTSFSLVCVGISTN